MTKTENGLEEFTPVEYFSGEYNIHMNTYIFEYRDKKYRPQLLMVEAEGKKSALEKGQKMMKKGEYLVPHAKRCFTSTQGNLLKSKRF